MSHGAPRGMTLLELVVGLTVTGLALSAGFGALSVLDERRRRLESASNAVAHAATLRDDLISWLGGAHLVAEQDGPSFRGLDAARDRLPADELTFLTTAYTPLGAGETIVRLYVDRDSASVERGLTAQFTEWHGAQSVRVELEPRVAGLEIRYLSGVMGRRAWLPSWVSTTLLPAGIEMRLVTAPTDTLAPLLGLPIHVAFRGGQ